MNVSASPANTQPVSEVDTAIACPSFLSAAEGFEEWHQCATARGIMTARRFSTQFDVAPELAHLAMMAGVAHFLGESVQLSLPHATLDCLFNLLIVTPETRPTWPGVFLRFPAGGIKQLEQFFSCSADTSKGGGPDGVATLNPATASSEAQRLSIARILIGRIPDTILVDSARLPVSCSPLDRRVTLVTPVRGLKKALENLTASERVVLNETLLGARSNDVMPDYAAPAIPAFVWSVPETDAASVFSQHRWLSRVPFLLMHSSQPSQPSLENNSTAMQEISKLSEALFLSRLSRMRNPKMFHLSDAVAHPVTKFMREIGRWSGGLGKGLVSLEWLGDLALRFSLLITQLESSDELHHVTLVRGVESAKFYGRLHWQNLTRYGLTRVAESADISTLTERERQVFLRICEKEGLKRAELRRGFNRMSAEERDEIVAKLISGGFVRLSEGGVLRSAV